MSVDPILRTVAAAAPDVRNVLARERGKRADASENPSDGAFDNPSGGASENARGGASENPSGDAAIAADDAVDRLLEPRLTALDVVGAYASEERERVTDCGDGYAVTVDPVDGSSNLRSNNPVGTVVGVYDATLPAIGTSLVASAIVVYGPVTSMVVARDGETRRHTVDDGTLDRGRTVSLPDSPDVFGVAGRGDEWPDAVHAIPREHELHLRYTGAMVADAMQVLQSGGLAWYPALESRPNGVLRLQYESNPVAHVVECAGGRAIDGDGRLREREPTALHERIPTAFGNASLVDRVERN